MPTATHQNLALSSKSWRSKRSFRSVRSIHSQREKERDDNIAAGGSQELTPQLSSVDNLRTGQNDNPTDSSRSSREPKAIAKSTSSRLLASISRSISFRRVYVDEGESSNQVAAKDAADDGVERRRDAADSDMGAMPMTEQDSTRPSTAIGGELYLPAFALGHDEELERFEAEIRAKYTDFLVRPAPAQSHSDPTQETTNIRLWPEWKSIHYGEAEILGDGTNDLEEQQEAAARFPVNWNDDKLATFDNSLNIVPCMEGLFRGRVANANADGSVHGNANTTPSFPSSNDLAAVSSPPVTQPIIPAARIVPEGCGMCFFPSGKRSSGVWRNGAQNGFGIVTDAAFAYEGQWKEGVPHGYGVGWYAFGQAFAGTWANGIPTGLGKLIDWRGADKQRAIEEHEGWFHKNERLQKLQCADINPGNDMNRPGRSSVRRTFPPQFAHQPLRGLYIACMALETARQKQFARVLDIWRAACCDFVVQLAFRSRLAALVAWNKARLAQELALLDASKRMVASRKTEDGLLARTLEARATHERTLAIKNKFQSRADHAVFMQRVIEQCEQAEERNAEIMQQELDQLEALLDEAKQSKRQFLRLNDQFNDIKHQVDDVALQVNKLKHAIVCLEQGGIETLFKDDEPLRRIITPSSAKDPTMATLFVDNDNEMSARKHHTGRHGVTAAGSVVDHINAATGPQRSVCDVEGCLCGVPRDVFLYSKSCYRGED